MTAQSKETSRTSQTFVLDVPAKLFLNLVDRLISFEHDNPEAGKLAAQIASYLYTKGEALPEEKIASSLNMDAGEIRKIIHTLYKFLLIEVDKEAVDPERGRYENRWRVSRELIRKVIYERVKQVVEVLKACVQEISTTAYYVCPTCFRRYSMDEAYDLDFRCPRDNSSLIQPDMTTEVEFLTNVIRQLQEYAQSLAAELKPSRKTG